MPVEGKIPWIPREYLRPMEDPLLAVGDGEKYDEFLEHTTNEKISVGFVAGLFSICDQTL